MKKISTLALLAVSGMLLLASCSKEPAKPSTYELTFHQTAEGENEDYVFVVTPGITRQTDAWAVEPDINPKEGYSAVWGEYNVEEMTADLTIEPVYTPIQYKASFYQRDTGDKLGESLFTVEDTVIANIPALPTLFGYTYAWEPYAIEAHDMSIYCDKTANVHTITFYYEDEEGNEVELGTEEFTIETESVEEPAIPAREGYDSYWPEYDLTLDQDIEVVAHYELHHYYVQFVFEGKNVGDPVPYDEGDTYADLIKPEVPEKTGYTVAWPTSVELAKAEIADPQVIEGIATANTYTVSYEGSEETTSVTYDAPYELLSSGDFYAWFYNGEEIATSGQRWNIADDVELTQEFNFTTYKAVDFEDGLNRIITIDSNVTSLEVVDEEGLHGSKALKAVFPNGDGFLNINKDYLDLVFGDPEVKALSFYAKGTLETNNFRHITVDASKVNGNSDIVSCYEQNNNGYGITTTYKQFFLLRGVYEEMGDDDWAIKYGGQNGPHTLYLDKFQTSKYDYFDFDTVNGLENGCADNNVDAQNKEHFYLRNPVTRQAQFQINAGDPGTFDSARPSYDMKTEGERSITFHKNGGYVSLAIKGQNGGSPTIPDEGIFFDYYADFHINGWFSGGGGNILDGKNGRIVSQENESVKGGIWHTFHFTKDQIASDGRFLILQGSPTGNIYIDNIRYADPSLTLTESFEGNKYVTKFGDYTNVTDYDIASESQSNAIRDANPDYIFIFEWNGCNSAAITNERASDGGYSLKLDLKGVQNPVRVLPRFLKLMSDTSTISFDVYTEDVVFLDSHFDAVELGVWTTVTFAKSEFAKADANRLFSEEKWCEKGTLYIDNIVVAL